jgi:hypothetical protein
MSERVFYTTYHAEQFCRALAINGAAFTQTFLKSAAC